MNRLAETLLTPSHLARLPPTRYTTVETALALQAFVSEASTRILRSVQKGEISTFIGLFGPAYKEKFNDSLDEREVTIYNNAVSQRHKVAHQGGGTMTFKELPDVITVANKILDSAEKVLTT